MEDYIKDAIDASNDEWFGEAYDKEWALKDQGFREGIEQGIEQTQRQLIKRLLKKKYSLEEISEISGLSIKEIRKLNTN